MQTHDGRYGMTDKGTGMGTGSEKVISTHTCGTHIHVPSGFTVPVSNTNQSPHLPARIELEDR